jgi:hypothetical protein
MEAFSLADLHFGSTLLCTYNKCYTPCLHLCGISNTIKKSEKEINREESHQDDIIII